MTSETQPAESLVGILRRVPLFERLDDTTIREISRAMRPLAVAAGSVVMRQGDPGDAFYVIDSGEARVVVGDLANPTELARLGAGRYFGEGALVTGEPRSASVVATQDCTLLVLDAADFRRLVDHYPAFRTAVQRVAQARAAGGRVFENEAYELVTLEARDSAVRLGLDPANEIVLDFPGVAPFHAEVRWRDGAAQIVDLGSAAGTYLNGSAVTEARLGEGDILWLGAARLFLHDGSLRLFQPARGVRLDARGLGRRVGKKTLLRDVDLTFYPGEMVAVVGPSGAGKTTLLHLLLGLNRPSAGTVLYDGEPLGDKREELRSLLGYVPQQDIVHPELTPRECLEAAARLRAESSAEATRLQGRIDSVLREVRLDQNAETRVARLSGGQRKRASVAVELLTEPKILFLDEPTSGLDPALDDQMMHLFRALADAGRTVVLTTHATRNLRICDRVVVVSGGYLVFTGTPAEALEYFEVEDFSEIYAPLLQAEPEDLVTRFEKSPMYARTRDSRIEATSPLEERDTTPRHPSLARQATVARQFLALAHRDLRVILRDRVNLVLRILGPPLMAGALLLTFESTIFEEGTRQGGNVREAITLLYLSASICLFLSAITSSNAITREDPIYRRERVVSLSPLAYAGSKLFWLCVTAIIQGTLVTAVLALGVEFPEGNQTLILIACAMSLTAAAGGALGLFISSLSPNSDRAAILAVLAMIPQLIFAGSTVPRAEMERTALVISDLTISKWTLELLGDITNIHRRVHLQSVITHEDPEFGVFSIRFDTPYDTAFNIEPTWRWLVLFGWFAAFAIGMWAVQAAKGRVR